MIPEAPAACKLEGEPVVELTRENWIEGIEIDAEKSFPSWDGGAFDLAFAIEALRTDLEDLSLS